MTCDTSFLTLSLCLQNTKNEAFKIIVLQLWRWFHWANQVLRRFSNQFNIAQHHRANVPWLPNRIPIALVITPLQEMQLNCIWTINQKAFLCQAMWIVFLVSEQMLSSLNFTASCVCYDLVFRIHMTLKRISKMMKANLKQIEIKMIARPSLIILREN